MSKVSDASNSDARTRSYELARMTGISEASTRTILKKSLKLACKVSLWIPYILANEKRAARGKLAKKLLKLYAKF